MKKLLWISILFVLAIAIPMPTMAGLDRNAGISLPPFIVVEARPATVMPAGGVYVVAEADADKPQSGQAGRDEKKEDQSLEKMKAAPSEGKSEWKINVWPVPPPDEVKSPPQRKDENKHTPPDRF